MNGTTIDHRFARLAWGWGAGPRPELVDAIVRHHQLSEGQPRNWAATIWGAVLGAVLGVLLKGMTLPEAPWGPGSSVLGALIGALAVGGFVLSLVLAVVAARRAGRHPALLQFASLNLLMTGVVLIA